MFAISDIVGVHLMVKGGCWLPIPVAEADMPRLIKFPTLAMAEDFCRQERKVDCYCLPYAINSSGVTNGKSFATVRQSRNGVGCAASCAIAARANAKPMRSMMMMRIAPTWKNAWSVLSSVRTGVENES